MDPVALTEVRELAETIGVVMVSSARTVQIVWGRRVPDVAFLTVGPASTAAVVSAGGRVELEGEGGLADLVRRLDAFGVPAVVFPHAMRSDLGRSGLERSDPGLLGGVSTTILSRPVYRTEPISPPDVNVDAVAFASPSAVDGWFSGRKTDALVVAAIGATTSRRLQEVGVTPDVIPDHPGFPAMAQSLAVYRGVKT
jgi:uroporphyrinogen-III synthase